MNNDLSTLQSSCSVDLGLTSVVPLGLSSGHSGGNGEATCDLVLRQQAMDKAQQGDVATAIALFTQLIQIHPANASYFNNRGLLHFQAGQFQLALWDYHQAIRLNPRLAKVYNNRANCYAAMGQVGEAIADYELAIDLDPTDIRARLNLGITLRQLEWYDRAIETFEMALQLSQFLNTTNTVTISANLEGHLYAERGRTYHLMGDWNCAIADYHRSLDRLALNTHPVSASQRLRTQVKGWLAELLEPLRPSL